MNKTLKKITAVFTSAMMLTSVIAVSAMSVAADDEVETDSYLVAGSSGEIFGTAWDPANHDNDMTEQQDGTWTKTYTVDQAYSAVQLKTVKNETEWIGDAVSGDNVTFNLTGAGTFTVVYTPDANVNDGAGYTSVTGDIVEAITNFEYTSIYAAGNGEGAYLNGASWTPDAPANKMAEIAPDIWRITFANVGQGFDRQIKFAVDGAWTHNFGAPDFEEGDDMNNHIGEWMDAKYNSSNITFDTDDTCTIVATIDMSAFDFTDKSGAKFKIDIVYDEDIEPSTDGYLVAGSAGEIFGTAWDPTNHDNDMDQVGGLWAKTYTVDQAYSAVQLKTVKNETEWIGDAVSGDNVTFNLTGAGTFTVYYDPDPTFNEGAGFTYVTGSIVEEIGDFEYTSIYAVGNGEGAYLNGASWTPDAAANKMTEIEDGIWQITFENVGQGFDRQIKFAVDGAWTHNFGAPDFEEGDEMNNHIGEWMDAKYNSSNITFDTDDTCTIIATLDMTNFDFATKRGAKFKLDVIYDYVTGDVDGDGEVTIDDVTALLEYLAEYEDAEIDRYAADVNGDGKINVLDVTDIQRFLAEIITFD